MGTESLCKYGGGRPDRRERPAGVLAGGSPGLVAVAQESLRLPRTDVVADVEYLLEDRQALDRVRDPRGRDHVLGEVHGEVRVGPDHLVGVGGSLGGRCSVRRRGFRAGPGASPAASRPARAARRRDRRGTSRRGAGKIFAPVRPAPRRSPRTATSAVRPSRRSPRGDRRPPGVSRMSPTGVEHRADGQRRTDVPLHGGIRVAVPAQPLHAVAAPERRIARG